MKLSQILTLILFAITILATGFGIYLKINGTLTWGHFAGWEASTVALAAIFGRMVLFDLKK